MIRVVMEMELVYPYKRSMPILVEFCYLWDCTIMKGSTKRIKAIISMPSHHFKKIFGTNPKEKEYPIPRGMERFIDKIKVKKILVWENK